jgi:hypothetical protein
VPKLVDLPMSIVLGAIDADRVIKRRFRFSDELDVALLNFVLLHGAHIASRGSYISSFEAAPLSFNDRPLLTPSWYDSGEQGELEEVSPRDGSNTRCAVVPKTISDRFKKMVKEFRTKDKMSKARSGVEENYAERSQLLCDICSQIDDDNKRIV